MRGLYVRVAEWPLEAFLQAWGRSSKGWHGLIAFEANVRLHGTPERVSLAAWIPAARITKPNYVGARPITRLQLPTNRLDWPPPTGIDSRLLPRGVGCRRRPLPAGMTIDSRPAWQRKRRR